MGDYALLGDAIADPAVDIGANDAEITSALDRLEASDWTMRGAFGIEFRNMGSVMDRIWREPATASSIVSPRDEDSSRWWYPYLGRVESHFMQFNATRNLDARKALALEAVGNSTGANLLVSMRAYDDWVERNLEYGVKYAYNPIGRILIGISAHSLTAYPLRLHDTEAFARLVRLGFEIRKAGLRVEDVEPFMKAHPEWSTHPVDRRPFTWNRDKREIAVQPVSPTRPDRRLSIPVLTANAAG
jgi:hypothetical protein